MTEIFLTYIVNFLDFTYKLAVIAFVAKQFGYISTPKALESLTSTLGGTGTSTRSPTRGKAEANPLGDAFKGIFEQMAPLLSGAMKNQPKTTMNFSDEPTEENAAPAVEAVAETAN
jgi:hypothetical protein